MLQADLDELRQQVRDLTNRISRLEESLAPRESASPTRDAEPPLLPEDPGILSQVPDTTSVLPVLGGALLGLAGAYLLRAIAESGALPPRAVFTLGTLYAVAWLLWAARAPLERRFATTLYSLTSVLILSPLLWESTLRFHMITTWEASVILIAYHPGRPGGILAEGLADRCHHYHPRGPDHGRRAAHRHARRAALHLCLPGHRGGGGSVRLPQPLAG